MTITINLGMVHVDVPLPVPLLWTRPSRWRTDAATTLARRLGVAGEFRAGGPWLVTRDDSAVLELYAGSDSFRYLRTGVDREGRDLKGKPITSHEAARLADEWIRPYLSETSLFRGDVRILVEKPRPQTVIVAAADGTDEQTRIVAYDIIYRFSWNGYQLFGPGAKAKVTVRADGEISDAYRFWRAFEPRESTAPVSHATLQRLFSSRRMLDAPRDASVRCEPEAVTFGYLSIAPTEPMSILIPAIEARGSSVSHSQREPYRFIRYFPAVDLDALEAGRDRRLVNLRPPLLIA